MSQDTPLQKMPTPSLPKKKASHAMRAEHHIVATASRCPFAAAPRSSSCHSIDALSVQSWDTHVLIYRETLRRHRKLVMSTEPTQFPMILESIFECERRPRFDRLAPPLTSIPGLSFPPLTLMNFLFRFETAQMQN